MYQRTVLPNGIRVVTEYLPFVRSVTLGAWFEVGSRHELPYQQGISHFIEHMVFKGSEKYSAREIAESIDERGGYLNAFTGKEHTCYYFRILDEHFALASDVLRQMLLHPLLSPLDLLKERNVILEELNMYEDSPEDLVHDLFAATIWPQHPLGNSILGCPTVINGLTTESIRDFMDKHYTTDRLVIACAGNISHERVVEEFVTPFSCLQQGQARTVDSPAHELGKQCFQVKDTEQIHLCLGGPALSRIDGRRYALHLLDTMIGGGVSSLLFQELREERGLVYNTYSFNSLYRDSGYYGAYAGFSPPHWQEVWDILCSQFKDLSQRITKHMLKRAKGQLVGGMLLGLENTSNRMMRLARGELDEGGIVTPEEIQARIEAVKYEELIELAEEIYDLRTWSWAAIGPQESLEGETFCRQIC